MKVVKTIELTADNRTGAVRMVQPERGNNEMPLLAWDVTFPDPATEKRVIKFLTTKKNFSGPEMPIKGLHSPTENTFFFIAALNELYATTRVKVLWGTMKEEIEKED